MRKKSWCVVSLVLFFLLSFFYVAPNHVSANTNSIKITNQLVYLEENGSKKQIPTQLQLDEVPVGSKLEFSFTIENTTTYHNGSMSLVNQLGYAILPYSNEVLKINGHSATIEQYHALFNGTLALQFPATTHVQVQVLYSGVVNQLMVGLSVRLQTGLGEKEYTNGFEYSIHSKYLQNFLVNFYDDDFSLISSQKIFRNTLALHPSMKKRNGYDFIGFNTKTDGSGEMFTLKGIQSPMNYYAIYKKKEFYVSYYVDNKLFDKQKVLYGEDAPYLQIDSKQNRKFTGWDKNLKSIKENQSVYALFEDSHGTVAIGEVQKKETKSKKITFFLEKIQKTEGILKTKGSQKEFSVHENGKEIYNGTKTTTNNMMVKFLDIKVFYWLAFIFISILIFYIRKYFLKKGNHKRNV